MTVIGKTDSSINPFLLRSSICSYCFSLYWRYRSHMATTPQNALRFPLHIAPLSRVRLSVMACIHLGFNIYSSVTISAFLRRETCPPCPLEAGHKGRHCWDMSLRCEVEAWRWAEEQLTVSRPADTPPALTMSSIAALSNFNWWDIVGATFNQLCENTVSKADLFNLFKGESAQHVLVYTQSCTYSFPWCINAIVFYHESKKRTLWSW